MPRGGGMRFGGGGGRRGGGGGGGRSRSSSPNPRQSPTQRPPSKRPQPNRPSGKQGASNFGSIVAGSFLGSALGSIVGSAIATKMFAGRDPDTGDSVDQSAADDNPCKKELDYFLECAKYTQDPAYCKGASDALKRCADSNRDYFADDQS